MERLLIILVLSISAIVHQVSSLPTKVFECPNQSGDQAWFNRAVNQCPEDHETYHCLMVADKKTAPQYAEFCMKPQRIPKGEYVVFDNREKTIVHQTCPDGTYQPVERKSNDSMAFQCSKRKSPCNLKGQQPCDDGSSESDRTCRCDYTAGYTLEALAYGNPWKESCVLPRVVDLSCEKLDMCGTYQELNKYYQCVNKCPEGYYRPNGDGCHEIPDNMSSLKSETTTIPTIVTSTERDYMPDLKSDEEKENPVILIPIIAVLLFILAGAIILMVYCYRRQNTTLMMCRNFDGDDGDDGDDDDGRTGNKISCCICIHNNNWITMRNVRNAALGHGVNIVSHDKQEKKTKKKPKKENEEEHSEQHTLLEKGNEDSVSTCGFSTDGNIETDLNNAESTLPKETLTSSQGLISEGSEGEEVQETDADLTVPKENTAEKGLGSTGKAEGPKDAETVVLKETVCTKGNAEVEREESSPDCNEYMKDMKQAAGKKGLEVVDVPKDGSCFYHCVLVLYSTKNGWDVFSLRKKLKKYIESNSKHYKDFVPESWETFLSGIENNKWADHLEIKAMAEMLKVPITVHKLSQSGSELEVKEEIQVKDPRGEPMNIGHIVVNKEGFHFVALKQLVLTES